MKAKRLFAFVAMVVVFFVGCTKDSTPDVSTTKCAISLSTNQLIVDLAGDVDMEVRVASNGNWSVATNVEGVTVTPSSGSGDGIVKVSVKEATALTFYEVVFSAVKATLIEGTDIVYDDTETAILNIAQYGELQTNIKEIRSVLKPLVANEVNTWTAVPSELSAKTLMGVVSSDCQGGNLTGDYYYMTVQDNSTEPHSGMFVSPGSGVPAKYAQGDIYIASLEGAKYKTYDGVLQLQIYKDAYRVAAQQKLQPIEITCDKILEYESQYVVIKDCQPTVDARGFTFAEKYNSIFEVVTGETFTVYANKNAVIRSYTIPSKSGSVAGVAYRWNSVAEILPCNENDLQLTEDIFKIKGHEVANLNEIKEIGMYEIAEVSVVGVSTKSYVVMDSNGDMMLAYSGADSTKIPSVGDVGSLYGNVDKYAGVMQFSFPEFTKTGTTEVALTAINLNATDFDNLYNNISAVKYVQYIGKLTKNEDGYYDITPASANNKSTIHAPNDSMAATLEENIGNYVTIVGFALYVDHTALNVVAESVAPVVVSLISVQDINDVPIAGVTDAEATIAVENVAGEITATCDGKIVTEAKVSGTTLIYSVSPNESSARAGWIKLSAEGVDDVTIKVSQKGTSLEYAIVFGELGYSNAEALTSTKYGVFDFVFDQGTHKNSKPSYYNDGKSLRIYKGNTMQISSASATIEKIEFVYTTGSYTMTTDSTVTVGSYSESGSVGVWEGSASDIKFTCGKNSRITQIKLFYTE